jgi:hypothetical protein
MKLTRLKKRRNNKPYFFQYFPLCFQPFLSKTTLVFVQKIKEECSLIGHVGQEANAELATVSRVQKGKMKSEREQSCRTWYAFRAAPSRRRRPRF